MKTLRIVALGALAALAAGTGLVRAQEDAGVKLQYRWKPGQEFRYRMTADGTITTKIEGLPEGAAGAPIAAGGFPMELQMAMEMTQRINSVAPDGTATVSQQLQTMNMTNKVMGQQMVAKFEGGKFRMLMNGQPMQVPPGQGAGAPEQMGKPIEMKLSPRGQVLGLEGAGHEALRRMLQGSQLGQVFGAGTMGLGMLVLPEGPVKAGESWEDRQLLRLPVPAMPGGPPNGVELNYRVKNTLTRIEPAAGGAGRVAVITTDAEATMPETKIQAPAKANPPEAGLAMTMKEFKQTVNGAVRFDPDAGVLRDGDYKVNLSMKMEMPFPGAPGDEAAARPHMAMSGAVTLKVALLPEGKAKAAPAAK